MLTKRCQVCGKKLGLGEFSPCGGGYYRGVCKPCYAAYVRAARLVRPSTNSSRGLLAGTAAAATLDQTLAILRGARIHLDRQIDELARFRSAGSLLERAAELDVGLPGGEIEASVSAGVPLHEVAGTPGRLALETLRDVRAAGADAVEGGDVVEVAPPLEELGVVAPGLVVKRPARPSGKELARPEVDPEGFGEFYRGFPRHVGRRAASKAYVAALRRHPKIEVADLVNAAVWYAEKVRKEQTEERFVPHPATWLNQDRFLEEFDGTEA